MDVDFSKLNIADPGDVFDNNNIDNKLQPQIGAGVYYNTEKFYVGLSVPNFWLQNTSINLKINRHHQQSGELVKPPQQNAYTTFLIAGYVFWFKWEP